MFPLLFLYIWVKELALEGEWEMERIALKPLSERRNFLLGSYMGILKDSSIAMRSLPFLFYLLPLFRGLYSPSF